MNVRLSFSWIGLLIFALPMFVNIAYAAFPPPDKPAKPPAVTRWVEIVEQFSRMAYLFAVAFLVSREPLEARSMWLYLGGICLCLYYAVWLRYFLSGRDIALLSRPFLLVPLPLVVFPVLYYLCAALWLHNIPAAILMLVFGAAHCAVSIQSFR